MPLNPSARKLWEEIRNPDCTQCPLHKTAQTVCLIGDGPVPNKIMAIGEAPGYREDEVEKPFAGKAGKYLDKILAEVGLPREQWFISNAVKCRPPENATPGKTEVKACRNYLDEELAHVNPDFVLLLGNTALQTVGQSGIMKHRGELNELDGATTFATIHPAAVLRNPSLEGLFRSDLNTFARLVRGEEGARPPRVYLVRDRKTLRVAIQSILEAPAVAYDLETGETEDGRKAIACIGFSPKPGIAFVVPIEHPETTWARPMSALNAVGRALVYSRAKVIAHNAKYDDQWMNDFGIPVYSDFDTMVAAHIIEENRLKGLKVLAPMLLGVDPWNLDLSHPGGAMNTPLKKLAKYNAHDADFTLRLYEVLKAELLKEENRRILRLFKTLMMPALHVLTDVQRNGMWVNKKRLKKRTITTQEKLDKVERKLNRAAGEEINWNSPQQVGKILFGKWGLPLVERTKKGAASTKESVLLRLRHEHEGVNLLLKYRELAKSMSTYLRRWGEEVEQDGRIRPNYKLAGTVTGRLSSGKEGDDRKRGGLNIQQVPRDTFLRSIFGAPSGWVFVDADFSQIELRIAAHYSQDPVMMRYFLDGRDIHMETAVRMTGKPAHLVTKEERKKAKAVNFGFLFGMGAKKFVEYARDNYDLKVSLEEAEVVRKTFFDTFPKLRPWHDRQRRLVHNYGRVQSLIGRIRHLPDIYSPEKPVAQEAERQAINSPVQSLASDMMLLAMILLHDRFDPKEAKIVASVHDQLLSEIREDCVDKYVPIIREVMENLPLKKKFGVQLSVPIKVDITTGKHWSEGKAAA